MVHNDFEESYGFGNGGYDARFSYSSYVPDNWEQIAEPTMPLKASKLAAANRGDFQASVEVKSRQISRQIIIVNLISLLINLLLAIVGFYFAFVNNSSSTTAFAADCVLDFISSAIVLWRYHGNLSSLYMQAREQIACIYLGALFEISALAIIVKSISDITSGAGLDIEPEKGGSYELVYLAIAATVACTVLTVFKCALFRTLRDNSILLDVINTVISTVFALSIVMSQALISVNPSFWYLDPSLSIVLALFMVGFGVKVIHQNLNILKPIYYNNSSGSFQQSRGYPSNLGAPNNHIESVRGPQSSAYGTNLHISVEHDRMVNWQKTDYSTITFN